MCSGLASLTSDWEFPIFRVPSNCSGTLQKQKDNFTLVWILEVQVDMRCLHGWLQGSEVGYWLMHRIHQQQGKKLSAFCAPELNSRHFVLQIYYSLCRWGVEPEGWNIAQYLFVCNFCSGTWVQYSWFSTIANQTLQASRWTWNGQRQYRPTWGLGVKLSIQFTVYVNLCRWGVELSTIFICYATCAMELCAMELGYDIHGLVHYHSNQTL